MSKHGPCRNCPEPATAWIRLPGSIHVHLCRPCLDAWFDRADDQPELEPRIWGWLVPPEPDHGGIAAWATDPRNHRAVAEVLRREARVNPDWLRRFVAREWRNGSLLAYA